MSGADVGTADHARRPTVAASLRQLREAQKPGHRAPPYSRWVNRPIGRLLAAFAAALGLTPNKVTLISACCTFTALGLVALVSPHWWLGFVVAPLLLLGYALDSADGQLARLGGGGTRAGEWLDHQVDAIKINVLHGAVLISFYRFSDAPPQMLLVALGFQTVSCVFFFGMILIDQLRRGAGMAKQGSLGGRLQTLFAVPIDFGILCLCFLLIGVQSLFRPAYATLFALNAVILAGTLVRWWQQVRGIDRDGRKIS